ncbi:MULTISPECIES: hypothetical protein [Bradyrhizobium]|uniref:hypothetical protein n=1 Tax=Bradyrhizobium TaxID=374 RepID=UPI0021692D1A|nr:MULTISPECIES: hypothetical protein [Bradyrhizobium]MCS3760238.1 hypothetical protein [Bradyrhizobium centrosematis]MCS3771874.1 hypothetical protein [Bradyrhizobium centrosematis]MDT4742430.1 hypothetical protein [Bradyrhizobium sp. WYCCWR 12699]
MLEISVFCVILLAAGYWTTMFVMGRRDDVIHGKFVHVDEEGDLTRPAMPAPPPFPKRPVKATQPARSPSANDLAAKPVNSEALQSLLAAIQQDLKSVA